MKYIKKMNELFLGGDKEPVYYYGTSKYFNPTTIEPSNPYDVHIKHQPDEVGKPGILKQKELILKASKIIGKKLSTYEQDRKTVTKEISDFIETNIDNKELSKDIDELTDINKMLKESKKCNLSMFDGLEEAAKDFVPFKVLDYKTDPEYGYEGVKMLLIRFDDGQLGLCIYDVNKKQFIEEPSELEDYNITQEELYRKYGLSATK